MKKILSVLLGIMLVALFLTGCESKKKPASAVSSDGAVDLSGYKFGILLYDYTDGQGRELKKLAEYYTRELGVTFVYAQTNPDEGTIISAIEELCAQNVNGILTNFDTALDKQVQVAAENEVYISLMFKGTTQQIFDSVKDNKYFLGCISEHPLEGTNLGREMAKKAIADGYTIFGIVGFPEYWYPVFDQVLTGFQSEVKAAGLTCYEKQEYYPDPNAVQGVVTEYLHKHPDIKYLFSTGSCMDFIYPVLASNGYLGKVTLGGTSNSMESSGEAFEKGYVKLNTSAVVSTIGINIILTIDKLNGNSYADAPKEPEILETEGIIMYTFEDFNNYTKYVTYLTAAEPAIPIGDLKMLSKTFNPDATYSKLKEYVNGSTLSGIVARRSK